MTDHLNMGTALYELGEALRAGDTDLAADMLAAARAALARSDAHMNEMIGMLEAAPGPPVLNDDEQEAMDALGKFMEIVTKRWRLRANQTEMTSGVHVLQSFVIQHMLGRLAPGNWNHWYADTPTPADQERLWPTRLIDDLRTLAYQANSAADVLRRRTDELEGELDDARRLIRDLRQSYEGSAAQAAVERAAGAERPGVQAGEPGRRE